MSTTFAALGASPEVIEALRRHDITIPFEIQALVARDAFGGRDVLAMSRTGSGKTLAFAIPIVERIAADGPRPSALILVPTRELARQVAEDFNDIARAKGLRVAVVYGGVEIRDQTRKGARAHIIVATPGRLEDLVSRRAFALDRVGILVLDEADRMLDMGFLPQIERIVRRIPKQRQTMLFSATLDGDVGRIASAYTRDPVRHEVEVPRPTVEELEHHFVPVTTDGKVKSLIEVLDRHRGPALVFVRTKRGSERLARKLVSHGLNAAALHGDMTQAARERSLARFESGKVSTLIATDVAARGLDLNAIAQVINFDPPEDDKAYVHRVGRTARAGKTGKGVTLMLPDQHADMGRMASRLKLRDEFEREGLEVPPPARVFSSHRRGRRGRRR